MRRRERRRVAGPPRIPLIPLELLFVVSVGGNQGSGQTDLELGSHKEHGWIEIG